jgi:osmotically-inducible protein OsmY
MESNRHARLALLLAGAAALQGCTAYQAFRDCGLHGCPGDPGITAQVQAGLRQHDELGPPNHVYVKTLDGVVYLTGRVATDLQRQTAESIVRATGHKVVNNIAISYEGH